MPTGDRYGGIHVGVGAARKAFIEGEVEDLVSAGQRAIDKKERRGQMANISGEKWLAVPLDGLDAAGQLEEAFGPTARLPHPDLSSVRFSSIDQVWLIAKTSRGNALSWFASPQFHWNAEHALLWLQQSPDAASGNTPRSSG